MSIYIAHRRKNNAFNALNNALYNGPLLCCIKGKYIKDQGSSCVGAVV